MGSFSIQERKTILSKIFNNKGLATLTIVLIVVAVVVVVGGAIVGVAGYNAYQDKKQQEAQNASLKAIDDARNDSFNKYNERINQIVTSLNVEKDGTSSIDNNEDVDALNNAVNELNNITNEINNDSVLTQEQKDALNANVGSNKNNINNRMNVVKESKKKLDFNANVFGVLSKYSYIPLNELLQKGFVEIPYAGMERHFSVPGTGLELVYDSNARGKEQYMQRKRIEGKLSDIISGVDKGMTVDEFIDGFGKSYTIISVTNEKGNPSSPYALADDHVTIEFSHDVFVERDGNTDNDGWRGNLLICTDGNNSVNPNSITHFVTTGGAL